jgi:hypothetical protein
MNFKEQIQEDAGVFLNPGEFADTYNIDGVEMPAIIDSDILKQRSQVPVVDGLYSEVVVLYIRLTDVGTKPVVNQRMRIDGELYHVIESNDNDGLLEITLGTNRA